MEEREEKLNKAREKLDKFRKKKKKTHQPVDPAATVEDGQLNNCDNQSIASSANSPVMFVPTSATDDMTLSQDPVDTAEVQPQQPSPVAPPPPLQPLSSSASSPFELMGDNLHHQQQTNTNDDSLAAYFGSSSSNDAASSLDGFTQITFEASGNASGTVSVSEMPSVGQPETVNFEECVESSDSSTASILYADKCMKLERELETERETNRKMQKEFESLKEEKIKLEDSFSSKSLEVENLKQSELSLLKSDLDAKSKTLELLVAEKSELQITSQHLLNQNNNLQQQNSKLESTVKQLSDACIELKQKLDESSSNGSDVWKLEKEKELENLNEALHTKDETIKELQTKLSQISSQHETLSQTHTSVSSELEMCKVHLTQLRGSGAQEMFSIKDQEIERLSQEVKTTRSNLQEAMDRISSLAGERDQLAEQYRSYSRDLASQAERLGEQLSKYQYENARLVHRESGLVTHVSNLESQLQGYLKDGRNVTEEELCKMKEKVVTLETDLRFSKDEKDKLQEMIDERGVQVDDMVRRLGMKDNEIMELRALLSGLETTVDMLKTTSQSSGRDQAQLLAACQSDKVAASRAMQQNVSLKERLEELQGALVSLTNSKADIMDQLESANRKLSSYTNVEMEISARDESSKEKDIQINNLRNQVKHLSEELKRRSTPDMVNCKDDKINNEAFIVSKEKDIELEQAKEMIRSLNSQNSELRSKLEVLSSNTRECSETRSNSSASGSDDNITNHDEIVETSFSESSSNESFEEINSDKATAAPSSDSFDNLQNDNENKVCNIDQTIISTSDLPFSTQTPYQSLENRFVKAMEQIAKLSLDKEQLEHLVERLQDETETIGDYVVMYQHQRQQQKIRMQEKEDQLLQLSKDRQELRTKLSSLQDMVTKLMSKEDEAETSHVEVGEEAILNETPKVSESMKAATDREKILELIADIGTGSENMIATCDKFEPWFWENSPHKVMTV